MHGMGCPDGRMDLTEMKEGKKEGVYE